MKRNLFAAFLAVALVVALVFVVAPNAKAETGADFTFSTEITSYTVEGDCVIDLNGIDATITVAEGLEAAPTVTVIDSKNLEDLSGESAGTLTVNGDCTIDTVSKHGDYRYLKVENKDENGEATGTYAFYPFHMSITMAGINAEKNTVSLEVKLIASGVAQELLAEYGLYKHDGENADLYANAAESNPFEEGKYEVRICFDLTGSLTEEMLNEDRLFSAYVKIDGMEEPIVSEQRVSVVPAEILGRVNEEYTGYEGAEKSLAKVLFFNNPHLRGELTAIEDATKLVATYEKITSIDELTSGNYVIVNKGNGRALGTVGTYGEGGNPPTAVAVTPTIENGIVTDAKGAVCEIVVADARVTLKPVPGAAELIAPSGGTYAQNTGLVSRTNTFMWNVADNEDGTFSFVYTSMADSENYQIVAFGNIFMNRRSDTAIESANPYFELYKEVTSEVLNCTVHADKEKDGACDFCGGEVVVIPDPKFYDYASSFNEKTINGGDSIPDTTELDEFVTLGSNYFSVSANQKTINAGALNSAYITIKSTQYDLSKVVMKIGRQQSSGASYDAAKFTCTVDFLDENGNVLDSQDVAEFVSTTTVTFDNLPDGCKQVKVYKIVDTAGIGSWFGLYNFDLTFAE